MNSEWSDDDPVADAVAEGVARAKAREAAGLPQSPPPDGEPSATPAEPDRAVLAWSKGWGSPWVMPEARPAPPASILRWVPTADGKDHEKRPARDAGPYRGSAGILAGRGGVGKSWAALDLAVAVATDAPKWLGFDVVTHGRVVYVAAEDPADVIDGRLFDLMRHRGAGLTVEARAQLGAKLSKRLRVVSLADADPELLRVWRVSRPMGVNEEVEAGLRSSARTEDGGRTPNLTETKTMPSALLEAMRADLLRAREAGEGVTLVVMDPLSRLGGSDAETDNAVAARLMRALGGLAADSGAAVVVCHHVTKGSAKSEDPADGSEVRGASAILDGARWGASLTAGKASLTVDKREVQPVTLAITKTSYGRGVPLTKLRRTGWGGLEEVPRDETPKDSEAREAKKAAPKGPAKAGPLPGSDEEKRLRGF